MIHGKKVIVVMPAYNAETTLRKTYEELSDIVDEVIVVDDSSSDNTEAVAKELGTHYILHMQNMGYGANQKTCYQAALSKKADIVIMVHPDYQYSPKLVHAMAAMLISGHYDIILASRIIGDQNTRKSTMPLWRYIPNRVLTFIENILLGYKLSEYHSGFRAYTRESLERLSYNQFSDDFIFDNELLVQAVHRGLRIGEISCPTRYEDKSSSINFTRSVTYGLGVLWVATKFRLNKHGLYASQFFSNNMKDPTIT